MAHIDFNALPDTARLWIFTGGQRLDASRLEAIHASLPKFLEQWAAHGSGLMAGYQVIEETFIAVGVDDSQVPPSGCSIDTLTGFMVELGKALDLDFLDGPNVCYRDGDAVRCVTRPAFMELTTTGTVTTSTPVFDLTLTNVGQMNRFEVPAEESWHGKAFDLQPVAEQQAG